MNVHRLIWAAMMKRGVQVAAIGFGLALMILSAIRLGSSGGAGVVIGVPGAPGAALSPRDELSSWLIAEGRRELRGHRYHAARRAAALAEFIMGAHGPTPLREEISRAAVALSARLKIFAMDAADAGDFKAESIYEEAARALGRRGEDATE